MKTRTFREVPTSVAVTALTFTLISVAVTLFGLKVETGWYMSGHISWVTSTFCTRASMLTTNDGGVLMIVSDPVEWYPKWALHFDLVLNLTVCLAYTCLMSAKINVFSPHSTRDPTKWWSMNVQTLVVRWWSSLMTVHPFMTISIIMTSILAMFKMDTGSYLSTLITEADNTSWDLVNTEGTMTGVPWAQELVLLDVLLTKIGRQEDLEWKMLYNKPSLFWH